MPSSLVQSKGQTAHLRIWTAGRAAHKPGAGLAVVCGLEQAGWADVFGLEQAAWQALAPPVSHIAAVRGFLHTARPARLHAGMFRGSCTFRRPWGALALHVGGECGYGGSTALAGA